jgi:carboxyl-terminal processing protease
MASREAMEEVWDYVNKDYVDGTFNGQDWQKARAQYLGKPVKSREELYDQIRVMLKSLDDPYTRFLDPDQFKSLKTTTTGELSGIGIQIGIDKAKNAPFVLGAVAGTPAFRAGIQPGDLILAVNDAPTKDLPLDKVASLLKGEVGTEVRLDLQRGEKPFKVSVKRETIQVNPVTFSAKQVNGQTVGYIRLSQFNANAAIDVQKAIQALEQKNVSGYLLDLRSNPGGLVTGGTEIARFWLSPGQIIVYTVNRQGAREEALATKQPLTQKPLVLLIDQFTASASEILAGALKDNKRAVLVGKKTFGKGVIQAVHTLKDGSGLAVTIARYQTPNRIDIHKKGIEPDVVVALPASFSSEQVATTTDPQFMAGVKALNKKP